MMSFSIGCVLLGIAFGSGLTLQLFVIPPLMARVQDRSTVTRVSNESLIRHHTLVVILLAPAVILFYGSAHIVVLLLTSILLLLNLYQRFWLFTKLHLVKQPIGVQDLIQPDNVLREEFNRLQRRIYFLFRLNIFLLLIDLFLTPL
jgi:hypothetical protein